MYNYVSVYDCMCVSIDIRFCLVAYGKTASATLVPQHQYKYLFKCTCMVCYVNVDFANKLSIYLSIYIYLHITHILPMFYCIDVKVSR